MNREASRSVRRAAVLFVFLCAAVLAWLAFGKQHRGTTTRGARGDSGATRETASKPLATAAPSERPSPEPHGAGPAAPPPSPTVINPAPALASADPATVLPPDFLDRIVHGNAVSIPLSNGTEAVGAIEMLERDAKGVLFVQGRLAKPAAGAFFLQRQTVAGVAGPLVGNLRFDDEPIGWKIESTPDHQAAQLVATHIDKIICANYAKFPAEALEADKEEIPATHPTNIPIPSYQTVIPLQSLPGATGVIYLDFDGEKGPFPGWGNFDAAPSGANNNQVFDVWKRVCEDYESFNLNITTDRKVYDNAPQGRRIHVILTPTTDAAPGAGGVAFMNSFNWSGDNVCWSFYGTGKNAAEVIAHEVGHTLGLSHDGRTSPSEGYYNGHGNDPVGWTPIMGAGYYKNLSQWSKGEYLNANNHEDDLAIISGQNNNVAYRADDDGDTLATAKYLEIASDNSVANEGIIERTGDIDAFRFQTTGGTAALNINAAAVGPDLDILAEIVDAATSNVIATSNPDTDINASFNQNLPAGEYLLRVRGTGRGDPLADGYTNYGCLGSYTISGSVAGGIKPDRFALAENTANGTAVGTVTARNNHGANPLSWTIASGNTSGAFAINASTGAITVANSAALDFEALSLRWDDPATFELFVTITDSANTSLNESIRVVVTVTDVNEPPVLQGPASTAILERTPVGTVVGTFTAPDPDHFDFADFAITAGNTGNAFAIDANGTVTVAANIEVAATTVYDLTISATDHGTPVNSPSAHFLVTITNIADGYQPGSIVRTYFENISGSLVANLTTNANFPNNPDSEQILNAFDGGGHGDNFGSTIRGYVIPPTTGTYQFWIASDDSSDLYFNSTGSAQNGATKIAFISGATGQYNWTANASQQSATFNLTAGQPYYIEARHKEATGGDHVEVAWSGPGISRQVISGSYLAPFYQNYAPKVTAASFNVYQNAPAGRTVGTVTVTDANLGDSPSAFSITSGNAAGVFGIDATGRIFVANAGVMNASTTPTYTLTVQATDSGNPVLGGTGSITVNVFTSTTSHIWTNAAGGQWQTVGNWQGGSVANGDHDIADFSTLNLTATADVLVQSAVTIAGLKFADTAPSNDWTLNGGPFTLSTIFSAPSVDVGNQNAIIYTALAGNQGLSKTGAGTLALNGANTFTGPVTVIAGTLRIGDGTTYGTINGGSPVTIGAGAVATWWRNDTSSIPNAISGNGQWVLQGTNATNALQQSIFTPSGDNSSFTGELVINRASTWGVTNATQVGSGSIRVQDRGMLAVNGGVTLANTITIENGAGWHHNVNGDVVIGAIRMEGTNTFSGNLQLNQNTGVLNGDGTGTNSTLGAWGTANNTFSGVISGTGELSMSRYTSWNGGSTQTVNIDLIGTASNTYTGKTVLDGQGGMANLRLMKTGGAIAIPGGNIVQLGSATSGQANLRMGDTTATGATRSQWNNQFGTGNGGVLLNFVNASGQWMRFDLQGTNQSVAGLNAGTVSTQAGAVIQNQNLQAFDPGQDAMLTLIGSGAYVYNGYLRDQDNSGTTRKLHLVKTGSGTQTLAGSQIYYSGNTTVSGGRLILSNGAQQSLKCTSVTVAAGGTLEWNLTADQDLNQANTAFSGAGVIQKTGASVLRVGYAGGNRDHTIVQSAGGVLDVQGGDLNIGWSNVALNSNQGGLYLASGAKLHNSQTSGMKFDWLSGSGDLNNAYNSTTPIVTIGVANTTNNAAYNVSGNVANFSGRIGYAETYNTVNVGTLSLVKAGSGTQILSGTNGYTGTTTVSAGTLLINGSLANTATTVAAGATLGGTGTINGTVAVNGTLAPVYSGPGTLTITKNTSFVSSSALAFDLGSTSDRVNITGNLVLDGTLNITDAGGFGPGTYTLITYSGSLTNNILNIGSTPSSSYQYAIDTATTGQVKLVVTLSAFGNWQMANFGSTTAPEAAPNADPDSDGLSNLIERALGLNPNTPDTNAVVLDRSNVGGQDYLRLRVTRDASVSDVTIEGQSAAAPDTGWSSSTTLIEANTPTEFRVRDTLPLIGNTKRFIKLHFSMP